MEIIYNGEAIPISISRSPRRRRLSISVDENGLEVKAAPFTSEPDIRSFIAKHRHWVIRNYAKFRKHRSSMPKPVIGAMAPFKGGAWRVSVSTTGESGFRDGEFLVVGTEGALDSDAVRTALTDAYLAEAVDELVRLRREWMPRFTDKNLPFRLKEMRSRWGSCSSNGAISINWRLIMASPDVFEYVVVHELCHLRHKCHDTAFWREVSSHLPDASVLKARLRRTNNLLMNFPFKAASPATFAVIE